MTLAEKASQRANYTLFVLLKEGLFYKFYNEDAIVYV
jgi:hypothetical protein